MRAIYTCILCFVFLASGLKAEEKAMELTLKEAVFLAQQQSVDAAVVRIPEPELRETNLNELASSCLRFMEHICQERNIRLVSDLWDAPLLVQLDATLMEQVLVNIIKNAAEAIEKDGVISIRTFSNPLSIEIADTGKGISKEVESKLFSPFFSTKPNGQGIGLIFIREVLLKHGCTFSLHTYSDGLTRFRILFE